jgi:enoyl-[acyl-carrier-protein] reductase (NADH)
MWQARGTRGDGSRQTFRDGTSLVWHNGGIDGFTGHIGFLPERDIGLVMLNNMNPAQLGSSSISPYSTTCLANAQGHPCLTSEAALVSLDDIASLRFRSDANARS